jgi:predicted N-acyltransferase
VSSQSVELKVVNHLAEIRPEDWDNLLGDDDGPFLRWAFLETLERTGCAIPRRGWWPCHLTAWIGERLVAAAPAYLKNDSAGDFSRDWGLDDSAARSGFSYYPKLVIGVPFSPVTGRRILTAPGFDAGEAARLLTALARELCRRSDVATMQVLYHHPEEASILEHEGFAVRALVQYHWNNRGYADFDDWLSELPSKKRTQIRRERKEPSRQGIRIHTVRGDEIRARPEHWATHTWDLYSANCQKHFWGGTYLTRDFYDSYFASSPESVELVVAERQGRVVAGALNLASPSHLYGRYWGCLEEHRYLHFNVCIYQSVEQNIERGVQVFEGGAGGEHKLVRGFDPTLVYTTYLFLDEAFQEAVRRYFESETTARLAEVARWQDRAGSTGDAGRGSTASSNLVRE